MQKDHDLERNSELKKMEDAFIRRVSPELERRITARIIGNLVESLVWQTYPSEDRINPAFIKKVKKAEKGKGKTFSNIEEFKKYLANL